MCLQAYLAQVRYRLWASQVELSLAADILKVATYIYTDKGALRVGKGVPMSSIHLRNQHYTHCIAYDGHAAAMQFSYNQAQRGGMRPMPTQPWIWQQQPEPYLKCDLSEVVGEPFHLHNIALWQRE